MLDFYNVTNQSLSCDWKMYLYLVYDKINSDQGNLIEKQTKKYAYLKLNNMVITLIF